MWQRIGCGVVLCIGLATALAQMPAPFVGTWNVSWQHKTSTISAKMVLTESGGRWQAFNVASAANHCYGREVPIVVDSATDDAVTLKLKFSDVLAGCNDVTVRLKREDGGNISGTRSGAPLTVSKQ